MARIRSVHPGLFTNSDWVECSPMARLLVIGLWTHADDNGIFEWKPKTIKMCVFPGDQVEIESLIQELVDNSIIKSFDSDGKKYGAIKNFRKWQRPQKPKPVHPFPIDVAKYVGVEINDSTLPLQYQYDTDTGNEKPMEEVGGMREDEEEDRKGEDGIGDGRLVVVHASDTVMSDFDVFWMEYPNKKAKPKAKACYDKIRKRVSAREILDGLERAKLFDHRFRNKEYTPHPMTWLNSEGWNDEHDSTSNFQKYARDSGNESHDRTVNAFKNALRNVSQGH